VAPGDAHIGLPTGVTASPAQKLALSQAMERLRSEHPRAAQVVFLRFFCDLNTEQIAEALGCGTRSVERDWKFARAWLNARLGDGADTKVDGGKPT